MELQKTIDDLSFAYIFAAPLIIMEASVKGERNVFHHGKGLPNAKKKRIPRPGVDTVFSNSQLDLATSPLVLVAPSSISGNNPEGRYCTWQFIDAWSNVVALIGTGFMGGDEGGAYVLCGPGYEGGIPDGMTRVDFPTNMAWCSCRNLVSKDADFEDIKRIQEEMKLYPLNPAEYVKREFPGFPAPPDIPYKMFYSLDIETYFNLYNRLVVENPTYDYDEPALERIRPYGIGPGLKFSVEQFGDLPEPALRQGVREEVTRMLKGSDKGVYIKNGWYYSHDNIAHFGTDYVYRAGVTITGLVANPQEMAIYLRSRVDSAGEKLNTAHRYRLRFPEGCMPPVRKSGFWSITAYDMELFLIDNEYNKQRVCLANNPRFNDDGSLDCLFMKDAPDDEAWFGNFLPCGDGGFELSLRIYLPAQSALDHSWAPPCVERID